ncbi:MAG: IclR family transcriptional regulator, partial [Actinomycetota bacterium]
MACERETRKYRLGLKILDLAGHLVESLEFREVAPPTLLWLVAQTGETVHLATLDQDEMVFLDRVDGVQPVTLRTRVGFRAPVHVTAVGKAFLAFSSPATVDRVLRSRPLLRYTEHTITDRETFLAHLKSISRQGFA